MRRRLLSNEGIKSHKELGGVYSDGIAYTAIPHVHSSVYKGRVSFAFSCLPGFVVFAKNLFGGSTADRNWVMNCYNEADNKTTGLGNRIELYAGSAYVRFDRVYYSSAVGVRREVSFKLENYTITGNLDGVVKTKTTYSPMTRGRICLFTQNNVAGEAVSPVANRVPINVAIHYFRYWDGDVLAADLIPVRLFATGEVGFFDRVSRSYVMNLAGHGAFAGIENVGV